MLVVLEGSWDLVTRVILKVAILLLAYNPLRPLCCPATSKLSCLAPALYRSARAVQKTVRATPAAVGPWRRLGHMGVRARGLYGFCSCLAVFGGGRVWDPSIDFTDSDRAKNPWCAVRSSGRRVAVVLLRHWFSARGVEVQATKTR